MSDAISGRAVVLYGPPASGKSTITEYLEKSDTRFSLFRRLKVGPGRQGEYRVTTASEVDSLRMSGDLVWENERYGAIYAIDRNYLLDMLGRGLIPVLHAGQLAAVEAIVSAIPGVKVRRVSITCPRDEAVRRITARVTGDTDERIKAYDLTKPLPGADLSIDTSIVQPVEAARMITNLVLG